MPQAHPRAGKFLKQGHGAAAYYAFIPEDLPADPPLQYDEEMRNLAEDARGALGFLDGVTRNLPNREHLIRMFARKEALVSSQIEGSRATFSDILAEEAGKAAPSKREDVKEVLNNLRAAELALEEMGDFPVSIRLINRLHGELMPGTRGDYFPSGEFRASQNRLGGTCLNDAEYVPPPPHEVASRMGALERYLHDRDDTTSPLVKAGFFHAQFETIHPYLDGNGRLGRLLITLLLCRYSLVERPILYPSLFFKEHRREYYRRLAAIRLEGDWEGWIKFYLRAVKSVSERAGEAAGRIAALADDSRSKLSTLGRAAHLASRLLEFLYRHPIIDSRLAAKLLGCSMPSARAALYNLEKLDILRPDFKDGRSRYFTYEPYMAILSEGTDPL